MDKDIIALQEMLAHQSLEIEKLSDELYAQQKETTKLGREVKRLSTQLEMLSHQQSDGADEPPPPHY